MREGALAMESIDGMIWMRTFSRVVPLSLSRGVPDLLVHRVLQ